MVANLGEHAKDVRETAENMLDLDLMITVDTMTAHLAGALGIPTWTLLPYACDWRWMASRPDTPWYQSMRLFRQAKPGDWTSLIRKIKQSLEALPHAIANGTGTANYLPDDADTASLTRTEAD
jgi:ADP-heptose:LPS heptosyltransferase